MHKKFRTSTIAALMAVTPFQQVSAFVDPQNDVEKAIFFDEANPLQDPERVSLHELYAMRYVLILTYQNQDSLLNADKPAHRVEIFRTAMNAVEGEDFAREMFEDITNMNYQSQGEEDFLKMAIACRFMRPEVASRTAKIIENSLGHKIYGEEIVDIFKMAMETKTAGMQRMFDYWGKKAEGTSPDAARCNQPAPHVSSLTLNTG